MDSVFIILVNYNNYKLTIDCIDSVFKSTYKEYSIVVVDNASTDGSFCILSNVYKNEDKVFILKSTENNGFSAGNNIGINFALKNGADYIMLLNNDTVIDKNMIEILHSRANDSTVTTPKMYYYSNPNIIWYAGGELNYKSGKIKHIGLDKADNKKYDTEKICSFVTGCCMMIHKDIFKKVGMLDENYFMYGEDVDYSIKLTNAGTKMLFLPNAKLWHKVGGSSASSKLNIYYDTRNKLLLMDKYNFSNIAKYIYRCKIFLLYIRGLIKKNNDLYFKKAYIDYKNNVKGKVELA